VDAEERFLSSEPLMKAFLKACAKAKEAITVSEPHLHP
jgi:hypothetical protein